MLKAGASGNHSIFKLYWSVAVGGNYDSERQAKLFLDSEGMDGIKKESSDVLL